MNFHALKPPRWFGVKTRRRERGGIAFGGGGVASPLAKMIVDGSPNYSRGTGYQGTYFGGGGGKTNANVERPSRRERRRKSDAPGVAEFDLDSRKLTNTATTTRILYSLLSSYVSIFAFSGLSLTRRQMLLLGRAPVVVCRCFGRRQ